MKTMNTVEIVVHNGVEEVDTKTDTTLYHYNLNTSHPSVASQHKGIVRNSEGKAVAQSFGWADTVISETVPESICTESTVISLFEEATLLRFYSVKDKITGEFVPKVGTFKRLDISELNSRIGRGETLITLINTAIKNWEINTRLEETGCYAYTPTKWQELCIPGYCNVFFLKDVCNQITDLQSMREDKVVVEYEDDENEITTQYSTTGPQLIYCTTLIEDGDFMSPYTQGLEWQLPKLTAVRDIDSSVNQYCADALVSSFRFIVPSVTILDLDSANQELAKGGAVVLLTGNSEYTTTTKVFSPEYANKVKLAGNSMNVIHRCFELFDSEKEQGVLEYLSVLPESKKISIQSLIDTQQKYLKESSEFLSANILARCNGETANLSPQLYKVVGNFVTSTVQSLKKTQDFQSVLERTRKYLESLSWTEQHTIHGKINRMNILASKAKEL